MVGFYLVNMVNPDVLSEKDRKVLYGGILLGLLGGLLSNLFVALLMRFFDVTCGNSVFLIFILLIIATVSIYCLIRKLIEEFINPMD